VPAEHWFGNALHCSINWPCSDAAARGARVFAHRSGVLGFYVVVMAGLARPTENLSTRNRPALAPSRRRFDWEISITRRWRGGRPGIALETRQLIREIARANFIWGAPRIHGELLKPGITVSQATVSRYMPPSRKDRRSQAWRTFIRSHGNTVIQSCSFNGYNWTRDLLSQTQVGSQSRVFTYRLSAFVVVPSCWAVCHTTHLLPVP